MTLATGSVTVWLAQVELSGPDDVAAMRDFFEWAATTAWVDTNPPARS
ncbi:MAG: hypothetical protein WKF43_05370 [Acidimicrobiales bacterium]